MGPNRYEQYVLSAGPCLIHNWSSNPGCATIGHRRRCLFLGEQVGLGGYQRFSLVLGTLLIIQPGTNTFDITATLVLIAALGMALRDIATKLVRESFSTCFFFTRVFSSFSGVFTHHERRSQCA